MANKNKVDVTVKGRQNTSVVAGGKIGRAYSGDSENEVNVKIDGERLNTTVAGSDVSESALFELRELLKSSLEKTSDREDIDDIAQQLNEQAHKPAEERSKSKVKRLLKDLASYVGLASVTITQIEKIRALYEQVSKLFGL